MEQPSFDVIAQLVDLAEDAIVSIRHDQSIWLFNRGAQNVFGYRPEEVLGQKLDILIPERFRTAHDAHVSGFATGGPHSRLMGERRRVFGLRKNGTEFPAEATISRLEHQGQPIFNVIVRDVTERVLAEQQIQTLNQELEERVRERTRQLSEANLQLERKNDENETFVYTVSHDLRAPLVNLEGFSQELEHNCAEMREILTHPGIPPEVRLNAEKVLKVSVEESLGFIRVAVARLSSIIDALLRLARVGRVRYEPRWLQPEAIVARIVQSLRVTIEQKQAQIRWGKLPEAWMDPVAAEQLFSNLIGNALNYLDPNRPGEIEIGVVDDEPVSRQITFFVRDNGIGIPASHQSQVFQAFRRLRPELAPGEGMGLIMMRRLLNHFEGQIWFESTPGVGSTFYFSLPRTPKNVTVNTTLQHETPLHADDHRPS